MHRWMTAIIVSLCAILVTGFGLMAYGQTTSTDYTEWSITEQTDTRIVMERQIIEPTATPTNTPEPTATATNTPVPDQRQPFYSLVKTMENVVPLDGATVSGNIYVQVPGANSEVTHVNFYIDDVLVKSSGNSPYYLTLKDNQNYPKPYDTNQLTNGTHTMKVDITLPFPQPSVSKTVTFIVENIAQPTATPEPGTPTVEPTPTETPPTAEFFTNPSFTSVGIELNIAQNGPATLEYNTGNGWQPAFDLWWSGEAYTGSVLFLPSDTDVQLRATVNGQTYETTARTDADNRAPDASTLTPTHTLCPVGCDYATLQAAFMYAPSAAVVSIKAGSYGIPENKTIRTQPITLIGESGAVVEPQTTIAPGSWEQVTFTGPATGQEYTVWKAVSPVADPNFAQIECDGCDPTQVGHWRREMTSFGDYTMTTPEGWTEVLYVNDHYRYGYTSFGNDMYVRLPEDADPNQFTFRVHSQTSYDVGTLSFDAPDTRVTGLIFNMVKPLLNSNADNFVFDHNTVYNTEFYMKGDPNVTPNTYPENVLVEYNNFQVFGVYDRNLQHNAIPWMWVKGFITINGVKTPWGRIGDLHEQTAVHGRGGGYGVVVRNNLIEGYFNGIGAYNASYDRHGKSEYDIYDNTIRYIADDVFETDSGAINWRVWDNHVEYAAVQVSTGPARRGPFYLINNAFLNMSNDGVGTILDGDTKVQVLGFKYSGSSTPQMLIVVVGNTFHSTDPNAMGGYQAAGGGGSPEFLYLRNNIFIMHRYAISIKCLTPTVVRIDACDEDYNAFYTSDPTRGIEINGRNKTTMDAYREFSPDDGANSNPHGDLHDPIQLNADGSLPDGSPLIDAGVVVPNLTRTYNGAAPDIGAIEK